MDLNDLELCQFSFFLRKTSNPQGDGQVVYQGLFYDRLAQSLQRIYSLNAVESKESIDLAKKREADFQQEIEQGVFVPLKTTDFIPDASKKTKENRIERKIISGIFHDSYVIQEWVLDRRKISISSLEKVKDKLIDAQEKHEFIEKSQLNIACFCYFTELNKELTQSEGLQQAGSIAKKLLKLENPLIIEFDHSYFSVYLTDNLVTAVIISKSKASNKDASIFIKESLRTYFLSLAKVANEFCEIKKLNGKKSREGLDKYIRELKERSFNSLSEIETANKKLTTLRVDLAEINNEIERKLHTIELNIKNAIKVINNNLLREKRRELYEALIEHLKHSVEQSKADLAYLKNSEVKSAIIAEEIANEANLQSGIYGRRLTWLFGLMSLLGIFQLFQDELKDYTTIKIVLVIVIGVLTFGSILFRNIKSFIASYLSKPS